MFYLYSSMYFENCALLGCYATSSGNSLPTFSDKLSVQSSRDEDPRRLGFMTVEDGTDRLSLNVDNVLPLLAE
jgi:hypothetical protein